MSRLLYIRGEPGAGKITTARIVAQDLGWKLLWFHDFDFLRDLVGAKHADQVIGDAVYEVLKGVFRNQQDVIYVRPSRTPVTVERIRNLALLNGYEFILVGLTADYMSLSERVSTRKASKYRINSTEMLDEYLSRPEHYEFPGQITIDTTNLSPIEVAVKIEEAIDDQG